MNLLPVYLWGFNLLLLLENQLLAPGKFYGKYRTIFSICKQLIVPTSVAIAYCNGIEISRDHIMYAVLCWIGDLLLQSMNYFFILGSVMNFGIGHVIMIMRYNTSVENLSTERAGIIGVYVFVMAITAISFITKSHPKYYGGIFYIGTLMVHTILLIIRADPGNLETMLMAASMLLFSFADIFIIYDTVQPRTRYHNFIILLTYAVAIVLYFNSGLFASLLKHYSDAA